MMYPHTDTFLSKTIWAFGGIQLRFDGYFLGEPKLISSPEFFYFFRKRTFGDKWHGLFYWLEVLRVSQLTVSKLRRKRRALIPNSGLALPCHSFIHHLTADGKDAASFFAGSLTPLPLVWNGIWLNYSSDMEKFPPHRWAFPVRQGRNTDTRFHLLVSTVFPLNM